MVIASGSLFYAPVPMPKRILDLGTGSGIWAIKVADEYKETEVVSVDIAPIQPIWIPPNLNFEVANLKED